jgi:prevent-host-death family protein
MKNTYSVARARANLSRLLKEAEDHTVCITRDDEAVAFIVSRDRMEAIVETLEIMASPEAMDAIRKHKSGTTKFLPVSVLDEN